MKVYAWGFLAVLLLLASCGDTHLTIYGYPHFKQIANIPAGKGVVYIYRLKPSGLEENIFLSPLVSIKGKTAGYSPWARMCLPIIGRSGEQLEITIGVWPTTKKFNITIPAGSPAFYRMRTKWGIFDGSGRLEAVDPSVALRDLAQCRMAKEVNLAN